MFTEYIYNVDGRKRSRFFESWQNAEKALLQDYKSVLGRYPGAIVLQDQNYFDNCKGIPVRDIFMLSKDNSTQRYVTFKLSLITCYFED